MLDPKLIKEKPEMIRNMLKSRAVEFDLDELIKTDEKRREFIIKTDELRKKKNQVGIRISEKKKAKEDASSILAEMKNISNELTKFESEQEEIENKYLKLASTIPNLVHRRRINPAKISCQENDCVWIMKDSKMLSPRKYLRPRKRRRNKHRLLRREAHRLIFSLIHEAYHQATRM